ncbi:hypothetical protein HHI36_000303, partial [Cryptolaemus montrouzieri]
ESRKFTTGASIHSNHHKIHTTSGLRPYQHCATLTLLLYRQLPNQRKNITNTLLSSKYRNTTTWMIHARKTIHQTKIIEGNQINFILTIPMLTYTQYISTDPVKKDIHKIHLVTQTPNILMQDRKSDLTHRCQASSSRSDNAQKFGFSGSLSSMNVRLLPHLDTLERALNILNFNSTGVISLTSMYEILFGTHIFNLA